MRQSWPEKNEIEMEYENGEIGIEFDIVGVSTGKLSAGIEVTTEAAWKNSHKLFPLYDW